MKLMFASDLHGSGFWAGRLQALYQEEKPDQLVLLGDLLYHGPRNPLPEGYNPQQVFELLNGMKEHILAVRGNCEAEVDQMVLEFPVMADYAVLWLDGRKVFLTHGHLFNEEHLPPLNKGDVLIHGHTHLRVAANRGAYYFLNPGSIALPKGDGLHSYMTYEDGMFTMKNAVDGSVLETLSLRV